MTISHRRASFSPRSCAYVPTRGPWTGVLFIKATFASDGDTGIGNCWHDTEIIERIWTGQDKQGKEGEAEADASLIARGAEETARRACRSHTTSVESAAGPGQRIRTGRRTACST
jgi:hypothetical protein